jgi:MOSC domain-containing protein YiiM
MQITSINISTGTPLEQRGEAVPTGIVKDPVSGPVPIRPGGIGDDHIEDLSFHGGDDQAVYFYGAEDYAWWSEQLGQELAPGTFGENLTLSGFDGQEWRVGDRLRIGTVELVITAPRVPCFKLGLRMGDQGFIKKFVQANRPGAYGRVVSSGDVAIGDTVDYIPGNGPTVSVHEVFSVWHDPKRNLADIDRILATPLAIVHRGRMEEWREKLA